MLRWHHDQAISWIKAHTGLAAPEAVGNATADRLAARGTTGSSSATVPSLRSPLVAPRTLVDLRSAVPALANPVPLPFRLSSCCPSSGCRWLLQFAPG